MKLPEAESAQVDQKKLRGYLLSSTHSVGKAKAALLIALGFTETTVADLEDGLKSIARNGVVTAIVHSSYGIKYVAILASSPHIRCDTLG